MHLSDREGGFWLSAEHSRREVTPLILKASAWDAPHTSLYTSPLALPLSSLPFCPPSIHLSIHWPAAPFNQTWLKRTSATPKVETVWTRLKEPLSPLMEKKKKKKNPKVFNPHKNSPLKANIVHSMSRFRFLNSNNSL